MTTRRTSKRGGPGGAPRDREITDLREAYRQQGRRFELLTELSRRLASTLDPGAVLKEVVDAACELTDARYGALGVFDASGRIREFTTHGVTENERARIGDLPEGRGLLGWLQEHQEPLRVAEIGAHARSVGFPPNHPPMKTFLGVPIRHEGEALGNLYLTEKEGGGEFTGEDESLLVMLAAQAALAIRNVRLLDEAETERSRLRAMVDMSPVGVVLVDAQTGEVVIGNREAERILGVPFRPGVTIEEHLSHVEVHRVDGSVPAPEDRAIMRALRRGERTVAEELRFQGEGEGSIATLVNATPIYGPDGSIVAAVAVIQDITPIEELERLRNEFLGMVSHELKTPLTAIKGSAAMAIGSPRPLGTDEVRELFGIIDEQADRLRDLIDNLLDMTRIEAGTFAVVTQPTDLREIVQRAVREFAVAQPDREVRAHVPDGLPLVSADGGRLGQVVGNLLSNAAKFSPANAAIEVRLTADDERVTVSVRDEGRGISSDEALRLFQKFSQLPDEAGSNVTGHGLGLAICRGIVEAHGGRIWVESDGHERGSTFSFTVPVAAADDDEQPVDVSKRATHLGRIARPGERTRVLVVDDDPQVLRLVQRVLVEAGYHPIATPDPVEALRLAELEEPDLVLLDLGLPGMDGLELLGRLREFSGVPVIFLTAHTDSETATKVLRAGADDYIAKPFAPTELTARIEASLRRRVLPDQTEVRPRFELEDLVVDFAQRRVSVGGKPVALSATEYKLLYELATNAGRVLTHDQILHGVWGAEYSGEHELVRSFIRNLRRKLGDDARNPRYVFTEPQVGYRMPSPTG